MPERKCKTTWRLLCEAVEHRLVYRLQEQENKFVAAQRQFEASNIVSGEDCASLKHFLITYRAQRTSCWASQELARAAHKHVVPPMKMGVLWCADVQKSIMSLSKMSNARHRHRGIKSEIHCWETAFFAVCECFKLCRWFSVIALQLKLHLKKIINGAQL